MQLSISLLKIKILIYLPINAMPTDNFLLLPPESVCTFCCLKLNFKTIYSFFNVKKVNVPFFQYDHSNQACL
jgi:hypothetical protein